MALFTLCYERNNIDECGSAIEKRKLVLQSLMQKVEGEIKFELFKTPDGKRYKANIIVMNNMVCDRVINILHRVEKAVDFPERMMISEVISLIVGLPVDSIGGNVGPFHIDEKDMGMPEPIPGHTTDIMLHKETNIGIPVELKKRSLEQLMEILPNDIMIKGSLVEFALRKTESKYVCLALYKYGSGAEPVFVDNQKLEFESSDPCIAVSMMIGHLKYNKLI